MMRAREILLAQVTWRAVLRMMCMTVGAAVMIGVWYTGKDSYPRIPARPHVTAAWDIVIVADADSAPGHEEDVDEVGTVLGSLLADLSSLVDDPQDVYPVRAARSVTVVAYDANTGSLSDVLWKDSLPNVVEVGQVMTRWDRFVETQRLERPETRKLKVLEFLPAAVTHARSPSLVHESSAESSCSLTEYVVIPRPGAVEEGEPFVAVASQTAQLDGWNERFVVLDRSGGPANPLPGHALHVVDEDTYRDWWRVGHHLVFVDASGTVTGAGSKVPDLREIRRWHAVEPDRLVLPAFVARAHHLPGQRFDYAIFGGQIGWLGGHTLECPAEVPRLSSEVYASIQYDHTSLASVVQEVATAMSNPLRWSGDKGEKLSVWIYTDGVDQPPRGTDREKRTLADWVEDCERTALEGVDASLFPAVDESRGWLRVQVKPLAGGSDRELETQALNLQLLGDAARCLGLQYSGLNERVAGAVSRSE